MSSLTVKCDCKALQKPLIVSIPLSDCPRVASHIVGADWHADPYDLGHLIEDCFGLNITSMECGVVVRFTNEEDRVWFKLAYC